MKEKDIHNPHFVSSERVRVDESYMLWIEEIKGRYKKTQIKAAVKVNAELLLFNWQLGRDLVIRKAEQCWGTSVVEQLSLDMKAAFPKSKGFSTTNLWNMKKWYLFYSPKDHAEKLHQLGGRNTRCRKTDGYKISPTWWRILRGERCCDRRGSIPIGIIICPMETPC